MFLANIFMDILSVVLGIVLAVIIFRVAVPVLGRYFAPIGSFGLIGALALYFIKGCGG
jgi:hypothetical protein